MLQRDPVGGDVMSMQKGSDPQVHVKPCYFHLIHGEAYEGPCRSGTDEQLTREFDERIGREKFEAFKSTLNTAFNSGVNMLEPQYLTWTDEFILREEQARAVVARDMEQVDLFLFDGVFHQFPASEIALRFKKPVGVVGCCASTDAAAALRLKGMEAYGYVDLQDAASQMSVLRVKKAIRNTNVLVALKNDIVSKGVLSTITNLESLRSELGVRFTFINAEELMDEVQKLTGEDMVEVGKITDELVSGAEHCYMKNRAVSDSVKFYVATKKLLDKYECNAFTIPCFEICATKRLDKEKYTFCLAHSLLKEEGIPSACEADINVLMALNVLINLTGKGPHMGNTHPLAREAKLDQSIPSGLTLVPEIQGKENIVSTWHAVPTRKMKGIDGDVMPYNIQSFTHSGWGATIRYDYNRDKGEGITLLRFHPSGRKMLAVRGTIVAGAGLDKVGCDTGLYYQVEDVKDFFRKELDFGHHYAWVYGDYTENLRDLAEALRVEIVTA